MLKALKTAALDSPEGEATNWRAVLDVARDCIIILDRNGRITFFNRAAEETFGYRAEEVQGHEVTLLVSPPYRNACVRCLRDYPEGSVASAPGHVQELEGQRKNGDAFPIEFSLSGAEVGADATCAVIIRDITEQRGAEEALREKEERAHALFEHSPVAIWEEDFSEVKRYLDQFAEIEDFEGYLEQHAEVIGECLRLGKVVDVNAASLAAFKARDKDELFSNLAQLATESALEAFRKQLVAVHSGQTQLEFEIQQRALDGSLHDVVFRWQVPPGHEKTFSRVLASSLDVTERKRGEAEQAALFEIARDISGTLDLNDILDRVQRQVAALLPCDRIVTYYWDAKRRVYRAIAWHGVPAEFVPNTVAWEFHPGQEVVDRLLAGETVLINDVASQTSLPMEMLTYFRLTALVLVPLVVRGRRMGALTALNAESGRGFEPSQVRLFEGIAQQVGIAMETADLHRAQREEAEVSGALARVGQELISSLEAPVLLERLCQVTTEVLACDVSHTFLWQSQEGAYVAVSGYGTTAEEWESIRVLRIPPEMVTALVVKLEREHIVQVNLAEPQDLIPGAAPTQYGITVGMYMALRRGEEIVGIQAAGYRGRQEPFDRVQERIARGLAQIASLALENTRLVEELGRANRLKSDFVATMSHELRTPLNVIIGYNDLLIEELFGSLTPEQAEVLQKMRKSSGKLLELISETLDLSRLETGQLPLDLRPLHLPDLLHEIDAETREEREEKPSVQFAWQLGPELPQLLTDGVKLKVVLKNLISNALKFTDQGCVSVRVDPVADGVIISVSDTGIGIEPETLPIIFEPFRQGEASLTRSYGGVGLGLHIVRRLLDRLGGTITVESEVGHGSTFRIWLPETVQANR